MQKPTIIIGIFLLVNIVVELVNEHFLELLIYLSLNLLTTTHKASVQIFKHNDSLILHHHLCDNVNHLTKIALLQFLNVLYLLPVLTCFLTIALTRLKQFLIAGGIGIAFVFVDYVVKRHLLYDIALHVD